MTSELQMAQTPRELALLKAIGFDKLAPEQRELALSIANRYDLDPMLKHIVLIDGKPYITRDGLLWVAHRSGQLDGIEVTKPVLVDGFWESTASVYRKDMSRPFTFPGRFSKAGRNANYAPEMAIKCAESMALRRAFNVAAPAVEERWDIPDVDVPSQSAGAPSLAERAAAKRAEVETTGQVATPEAAGASSAEPTAEPSAPGLSREDFLAALERAGISAGYAAEQSKALFPGVPGTKLTDEQRADLLTALLAPDATPLVEQQELDEALDKVPA
jgi:hypothetical protein